MGTYLSHFRYFGDFYSRESRASFWKFYSIHLIILGTLCSLSAFFIMTTSGDNKFGASIIGLLALYISISEYPTLAAKARRLHDVEKSGWTQITPYVFGLVSFIVIMLWDPLPKSTSSKSGELAALGLAVFITWIVDLRTMYLLSQKGDEGKNSFGPDNSQGNRTNNSFQFLKIKKLLKAPHRICKEEYTAKSMACSAFDAISTTMVFISIPLLNPQFDDYSVMINVYILILFFGLHLFSVLPSFPRGIASLWRMILYDAGRYRDTSRRPFLTLAAPWLFALIPWSVLMLWVIVGPLLTEISSGGQKEPEVFLYSLLALIFLFFFGFNFRNFRILYSDGIVGANIYGSDPRPISHSTTTTMDSQNNTALTGIDEPILGHPNLPKSRAASPAQNSFRRLSRKKVRQAATSENKPKASPQFTPAEETNVEVQDVNSIYCTRMKTFGPNHPKTLSALNNLVVHLHEIGKIEEAISRLELLVKSVGDLLGHNHPKTQHLQKNLEIMRSNSDR